MKSRVFRVLAAALMSVLIFGAASYLIMSRLYDGRFGYGVWIDGVYATGLRPAEVTAILDAQADVDGVPAVVMLIGRDGERLAIPTETLAMRTSYAAAVKKVYEAQGPLTWLRGIAGGAHYLVTPRTDFDLTALEDAVDGWEIFREGADRRGVFIERTPAGYQLVLQTQALPVKEEILRLAAEKIGGGEYFVSLDTDDGCYEEHAVTEEDRSVMTTWEAIERTRLPALSYVIGDERIPLSAAVTDGWLLTGAELHALTSGAGNPAAAGGASSDEEERDLSGQYLVGGESVALPADAREINGFAQSAGGDLIIKQEEIAAFVRALCEKYDTVGRTRDFTTADGRVVQVPAGTYGSEIDEEAEIRWLIEAVKNHAEGAHVPSLAQEGGALGGDDIGDTYIEVDIGRQTLYYFANGQLDTQIPIVTGNRARGNDTPPGVYAIYFMQKNRTLRGEDYTSFVHYWMAFYGNYGIHDATWRRSFGDEIYQTAGSHGCVNIPYAEAGPLYQKVSIGMPVIVHE